MGAPRPDPRHHHRYRHDRISAILAITVSPQRQRLGLYCHVPFDHLSYLEVAAFLGLLRRHLRGHILLLWDGVSIHRGPALAALRARHPRLRIEPVPAYAPKLNPDEQVWNHLKAELANGCPLTIEDLMDELTRVARRVRRASRLLRSFILQSDLPPFLSS